MGRIMSDVVRGVSITQFIPVGHTGRISVETLFPDIAQVHGYVYLLVWPGRRCLGNECKVSNGTANIAS